jgi:beta-lactamase superfamily II metal-dependent hydrolase
MMLTDAKGNKAGPRLVVTALGVGHGDATLIEWFPDNQRDAMPFRCLVDGGESPRALKEGLDRRSVSKIDLLVVSHFDSDHIGGLRDIASERSVAAYWGPCLPAFERHVWLFGDRVRDGIEKARSLEKSLTDRGTNIIYPLEGFTSAQYGQFGPILRILSPAAKIIRTLLVKEDIEWLVAQSPTPLGWLAEPEELPVEQPANLIALDEHLLTCALSPQDVHWVAPVRPVRTSKPLRNEWSARNGVDPEFFGDSILNNTSIVLWIDAPGQSRRYKLLLTGDQENWTYLLFKHPFGMQADLLKAPHHGGSIYIENAASHEEIFSAVRPKIVLFSANGKHGLPHTKTRESAIRWGSTVCCTSSRDLEFIVGSPKDEPPCCHDLYACKGSRDVSITLDKDGLYADSPACHSGFGTAPGPIIQIRQHHIEKSPLVSHLFEQELTKYIGWVSKELKRIHAERVEAKSDGATVSEIVHLEHLETLARASNRNLLAASLLSVLAKGRERGKFWAPDQRQRWSESSGAYTLPTVTEQNTFIQLLRSKDLLLFIQKNAKIDFGRSTLAAHLRTQELATLCDTALRFPVQTFHDAFWPAVYTELTNEWSCYVFQEQAVGFSRIDNAVELYEALFRKLFSLSTIDEYGREQKPLYVLREINIDSSILVSQEEKDRNTWWKYVFELEGYGWNRPTKISQLLNEIHNSDYRKDFSRVTEAGIPIAVAALAAQTHQAWRRGKKNQF